MNMIRCDRCGSDVPAERSDMHVVETYRSCGTRKYEFRECDLCPECVEELWEWVGGGNKEDE